MQGTQTLKDQQEKEKFMIGDTDSLDDIER